MDYTPYTSDMNHPQQAARPARRGNSAVKLIIFLAIVATAFGATYAIAQAFPDKMKDLIIAVDRFGITDVGALEQKRVNKINRLPITYEEKQVLIKRTVFLNATREMVYLALGDPVCIAQTARTATEPASEHWVYYIEGDRKPTRLSFQNNELVNAGKASALDTCK
jgi:hypothetical protein